MKSKTNKMHCCVKGCNNTSGSVDPRFGKGVHMHLFPSSVNDTERFNLWIERAGMDRNTMTDDADAPSKNVCSVHFAPDAYVDSTNPSSSKLKPTALPTLQIGTEVQESDFDVELDIAVGASVSVDHEEVQVNDRLANMDTLVSALRMGPLANFGSPTHPFKNVRPVALLKNMVSAQNQNEDIEMLDTQIIKEEPVEVGDSDEDVTVQFGSHDMEDDDTAHSSQLAVVKQEQPDLGELLITSMSSPLDSVGIPPLDGEDGWTDSDTETANSSSSSPIKKSKQTKRSKAGLKKKSLTCPVCHGPGQEGVNRKLPSLPFCRKCKKAYFYQIASSKSKTRAFRCRKSGEYPEHGLCKIHYKSPNHCAQCHFLTFQRVIQHARHGKKLPVDIAQQPKVLLKKLDDEELKKNGVIMDLSKSPAPTEMAPPGPQVAVVKKRRGRPSRADRQKAMLRTLNEEELEENNVSFSPAPMSPPGTQVPVVKRRVGRPSRADKEKLMASMSSPGPQVAVVKRRVGRPSNADKKKSALRIKMPGLTTKVSDKAGSSNSTPSLRKRSNFSTLKLSNAKVSDSSDSTNPKPLLRKRSKTFNRLQFSNTKEHKSKAQPEPVVTSPKKVSPSVSGETTQDGKKVIAIRVYLLQCGHACSVCNCGHAQRWLKSNGIQVVQPVPGTSTATSACSKRPHPEPMPDSSSPAKSSRTGAAGSMSIAPLLPTVLGESALPSPPSTSSVSVNPAQTKGKEALPPGMLSINFSKNNVVLVPVQKSNTNLLPLTQAMASLRQQADSAQSSIVDGDKRSKKSRAKSQHTAPVPVALTSTSAIPSLLTALPPVTTLTPIPPINTVIHKQAIPSSVATLIPTSSVPTLIPTSSGPTLFLTSPINSVPNTPQSLFSGKSLAANLQLQSTDVHPVLLTPNQAHLSTSKAHHRTNKAQHSTNKAPQHSINPVEHSTKQDDNQVETSPRFSLKLGQNVSLKEALKSQPNSDVQKPSTSGENASSKDTGSSNTPAYEVMIPTNVREAITWKRSSLKEVKEMHAPSSAVKDALYTKLGVKRNISKESTSQPVTTPNEALVVTSNTESANKSLVITISDDLDDTTHESSIISSKKAPEVVIISDEVSNKAPEISTNEAIVISEEAPTIITDEVSNKDSNITTNEAPVITTNEAPVTSNEAPVITTNEAPVITSNEAPVITSNEAPVITTNEAPVITSNEAPVSHHFK